MSCLNIENKNPFGCSDVPLDQHRKTIIIIGDTSNKAALIAAKQQVFDKGCDIHIVDIGNTEEIERLGLTGAIKENSLELIEPTKLEIDSYKEALNQFKPDKKYKGHERPYKYHR